MKVFTYAMIISAACSMVLVAQTGERPMFLQWSTKATLKSPDKQFRIEVHPILTDEENHSPVVVRRLSDRQTWNLFTLTRAAQAKWSPDSHRILVIDEPTADNYEVHLFSPEGRKVEVDTDKAIRSAVVNLIGPERKMEFYLPTLVSWKAKELIIAVGGTSSSGINKPVVPYCFAVRIDATSGKVLTTLSEEAMKKQFNSECRVNP